MAGTSPAAGGYDATSGQVVTLQLQASPALDVTSCVYSVVSSDPNAPAPTFSSGGIASPPTAIVICTMPTIAASRAHTYEIQCQTNNGAAVMGPTGKLDDFSVNTTSRVIAMRNVLGLRKMFVGESVEYGPNGWIEIIDDLVDQLGLLGSTMNQTLANTKTLTVTGTQHIAVFEVTNAILIKKLYGIVTSALSANQTSAQITMYDQTTRTQLTAVSGAPTISAAVVGSLLLMSALPTTALQYLEATAGGGGANSANLPVFQQLGVIGKHGAVTQIEFTVSSTDTPPSGTIEWTIEYESLGTALPGTVTAL